jgi:hypothetical protein
MSHYKYPRTFHLPWSMGATSDDKVLKRCDAFIGREVVATEKMDGENTSMYSDHFHARSLDSAHHPSRDAVKALWGYLRYHIPEGWRICGENLYAQHSIAYDNLKSYFYVFSVWNEDNVCLSWDETVEWCAILGLVHVPVLYRGTFSEDLIKPLWNESKLDTVEGYVVRSAKSFHYDTFANNVAKFVRPNHVQTDQHWMHAGITPNKLEGKS